MTHFPLCTIAIFFFYYFFKSMIFWGPSDPNFLASKKLNFGQTSHCAPPTIALFFFYSASSSSLPPKRRWSHYKDCRPAAGQSEQSYKWLRPVTSKINKKQGQIYYNAQFQHNLYPLQKMVCTFLPVNELGDNICPHRPQMFRRACCREKPIHSTLRQ